MEEGTDPTVEPSKARVEPTKSSEAETIATIRRLREWRRFIVETIGGIFLVAIGIVDLVRPGIIHNIIPNGCARYSVGAGFAILTWFGGDIFLRLLEKDREK